MRCSIFQNLKKNCFGLTFLMKVASNGEGAGDKGWNLFHTWDLILTTNFNEKYFFMGEGEEKESERKIMRG